jgi:hypothetical protein
MVATPCAVTAAERLCGMARNVPTRTREVACAVSAKHANVSPDSSCESTMPTESNPCCSANAASSQQPW